MVVSKPMADIHELILLHGRDKARTMVDPADKHLVDSAARILEDEQQRLSIVYSGFSQTSLPLRSVQDRVWRRKGADVTLLIESGTEEDGETLVGLPAGPKARMILVYLQTQAKKTGSPEVELGRSMAAWLENMGVSLGGATYKEVRRQARRINRCKLTFFLHRQIDGKDATHTINGAFVEQGLEFTTPDDPRQGKLWDDRAILHPRFYKSLMEHPVPLQEAAVRELNAKPMALDIYLWLAWRLHVLKEPLQLSWPALFGQFAGGYKVLRQFKPEFAKNLSLALAVYPGAKVELHADGAILYPSRSPIEPRLFATS